MPFFSYMGVRVSPAEFFLLKAFDEAPAVLDDRSRGEAKWLRDFCARFPRGRHAAL